MTTRHLAFSNFTVVPYSNEEIAVPPFRSPLGLFKSCPTFYSGYHDRYCSTITSGIVKAENNKVLVEYGTRRPRHPCSFYAPLYHTILCWQFFYLLCEENFARHPDEMDSDF
eukprot:scaffold2510_cov169-Amphora_coffeaeformis.AAC.53